MAGIILAAAPAYATTYSANPSNFVAVFAAAQGGDTIVVQGAFGATNLVDRSFTVPLMIDASGASFDNSLVIKNVTGVDFTGGTFGSTTGTVRYNSAVAAFDDSRLTFTQATVVGARTGVGIGLIGSNDVQVTHSTFDGLSSGIDVSLTTQATLDSNRSMHAAADGFDVAGSHMVSVTNSTCTGGAPVAGAHPDCVQLYSLKGQPVQSDITVAHNTATGATQGFTAFNPQDGGGLRYNISDNTASVSFPQGIACYACVDSVIGFNTLSTLPGATYRTQLNVIGGADNIVYGNTIDGAAAANQSPLPQPFDAVLPADPLDPLNLASTGLPSDLAAILDWNDATFAGLVTSTTAAAPVPQGAATAPEPTTWVLLVAGFGMIGVAGRRRAAAITV